MCNNNCNKNNCNCKNQCNNCEPVDCGCKIELDTLCVYYTGQGISPLGVKSGQNLTEILELINNYLEFLLDEIETLSAIKNIGGGAEIYAGRDEVTRQNTLRTLKSGDTTLLDVEEQGDEISFTVATPSLKLDSPSDILSLIMTSASGQKVFSEIDLSEYNYDTFVQGASFNNSTNMLTIIRNNGEPNIDIDLSVLDNKLESATYVNNTNTVNFTLTDGTVVSLNLTNLVNEIISNVNNLIDDAVSNIPQSDYLESDASSRAFIQNRNPSRSVSGNYAVKNSDNNYILEINNGNDDVVISLSSVTATTNFFVGFVQKGNGTVRITGYNIKPKALSDIIFGQGHIAAVEVINGTKYLHGNLVAE